MNAKLGSKGTTQQGTKTNTVLGHFACQHYALPLKPKPDFPRSYAEGFGLPIPTERLMTQALLDQQLVFQETRILFPGFNVATTCSTS